MIQRHKILVMFSVIAAIIIAAPISLYEFSYHSSGISVKSSNTVTNLTFAVNFTKYTETSIQFNPNYENFTSQTILDKGERNQSILETSGIIREYYSQGGGSFVLLCFNVTGSFAPNIAPSRLLISLEDSVPASGNPSLYNLLYGGGWGGKNNVTIFGWGVGSNGSFNRTEAVTLDNVTNASAHSSALRYHFLFGETIIIEIRSPISFPFPLNISIHSYLQSYLTPVFDQVNFHIEDAN